MPNFSNLNFNLISIIKMRQYNIINKMFIDIHLPVGRPIVGSRTHLRRMKDNREITF